MPLAPQDEAFDEWLRASGEQPPDFEWLPLHPDLPPLLVMGDGRQVDSLALWQERRRELRGLLEHWFWGTIPPTPPRLTGHRIVGREQGRGATRREVEVGFDCRPAVTVRLWVLMPDGPGPFPVFLTTTSHWSWAEVGLSRGYLCCVYPGADNDDQSRLFTPCYPDCDWRTIPRRAWLAGRALDYVLTLAEADGERVGISGHSRDGKQAMIATALDPRIKAVVSSSSGSGGAAPFRFSSEREYEESVEALTWIFPDWFHPRLRYFTGREQYLPTDSHAYYALIAPRPCLVSTATNDGCEATFPVERGYLAGREVYRFLGAGEALVLRYRPGGHDVGVDDIQAYFDWFDRAFGRRQTDFRERLLHHFDRPAWQREAAPVPPPPPPATDSESTRQAVRWAMGEEAPAFLGGAALIGGRGPEVKREVAVLRLSLGEFVEAELIYPHAAPEPLPVVVWLHPFSYPGGRNGAYTLDHETRRGFSIAHWLAERGYACLAFDQLGFGRRIAEGVDFYARYPRWSKLGRMVRDAGLAVDLLTGGLTGLGHPQVPAVDPGRVYLLGYSLGGMVALHAAAQDCRVAGVACFCGLHPLRGDDETRTGGIRRWSDWYGLLPRLGAFAGREAEMPYDAGDLLRLIAPRPCLVVSPEFDRDADPEAVAECVARAHPAWERAGAAEALTHLRPRDYNRFQPPQFALLGEWLERLSGKG